MDEQSVAYFGQRVARAVGCQPHNHVIIEMLKQFELATTQNLTVWVKKQSVSQLRRSFENVTCRVVAESACGLRVASFKPLDVIGRI